jgi:hypothetical protein
MNKNQGKKESICAVNVESNEISKIVTSIPFQVKIYDDLTNNENIVNKIKAEVKKLLGVNIVSNNYVITNLNKNGNNSSLNILFN